uniref:ATP synthase complex subunit 8 n=1 Tax=Damithrax spinosissimus TaxID=765936 RepID=A0A0U1XJS9_DAMSP|nr:ATP synthase F0 subunit 8 [Damithrax spinosissimus]AIT75851.1 ATP synthase F0 subunit 8 [Damithrax spinosissimus]
MPQMAPLMWMCLFIFFSFSLGLFLSMNYFIKFYNKSLISFSSSKEFVKTWKF